MRKTSEEEVVTHFPQEENRQEDESEEEVATHVRQGTIKSYRFTPSLTTCQTIPLILIENIRKTSTNLLNMILTTDSNEALQEETYEEDESEEEVVFPQEENRQEDESEEEVDSPRYNKILSFYSYQFFDIPV